MCGIGVAIDFSAHVQVPAFNDCCPNPPEVEVEPNEPEDRLKIMDKYGIKMQVVHLSAAHIYNLEPSESIRAVRIANDYIYNELVSKYPDRFIGCGAVSLLDADAALEEIDRIKGMGFKCVTMPTHRRDSGLDHPGIRKVLRHLAEHGMPLFLHPISWRGYSVVDEGSMLAFGWPFDTSLAVWTLITKGILDELPSLKVITHHLGSMVTYYYNRMLYNLKRINVRLKRPLASYLEQIYVDTALDGGSLADLMAAYQIFGSRRILFGSDWPFVESELSIRDNMASILAMPVPEEAKERILHGNAEELLGIGSMST